MKDALTLHWEFYWRRVQQLRERPLLRKSRRRKIWKRH